MKKRRYTNEQIEEIIKLGYPTLELLSHPDGVRSIVKVRCRKCGNEWECQAFTLIYGCSGCPECDYLTKPELLKLREKLYYIKVAITKPTLEVSGEYHNQKSIMHFKNKECGHEWDTYADSVLNYTDCPICANERQHMEQRTDPEKFLVRMKDIDSAIILRSEYRTAKDYIDCECATCHHVWSARAYNLLSGFGCPECANKRTGDRCRSTMEHFTSRLKEALPNDIPIGEYINTKTPIAIECGNCHRIYYGTPVNLYKGEGCPYCNMPHGERGIRSFLEENNIDYEPGKRYDELVGVGGGKLSYDFYLPQYNMLIEFQGEQHEHPVEKFGGKEQFKIQQEHDRLKREYAEQHNIPLLEIWYYDIDRVPDLLLSFISNITIPVSTTAS